MEGEKKEKGEEEEELEVKEVGTGIRSSGDIIDARWRGKNRDEQTSPPRRCAG